MKGPRISIAFVAHLYRNLDLCPLTNMFTCSCIYLSVAVEFCYLLFYF